MHARKPLFHLSGALDRGRFAAGVLAAAGALLTFALVTLNGQTRGYMSGLSFGVNLALMLALALCLIPLTLRRAFDLGWSVPKAGLAVLGSVILFPFLTLIFMVLPGRSPTDGGAAPRPLPKLMIVAAPIGGVAIAMLIAVAVARL